MGVAYNPSIITDGLVLAVDAANTKSYPGSGSIWKDLTGNGRDGTFAGSPTFSNLILVALLGKIYLQINKMRL